MIVLGWESRRKGRPWEPLPCPFTELGIVPYAMMSKFTHRGKASTHDAGRLSFHEVRSGGPIMQPYFLGNDKRRVSRHIPQVGTYVQS